jgi:hypothetical protein
MARCEDGPGPARPIEAVPPAAAEDPIWRRLEDQLGWYDAKSGATQRSYQRLKLVQLTVAAVLLVVTVVGHPVWAIGALAAVIVVLETLSICTNSRALARPPLHLVLCIVCIVLDTGPNSLLLEVRAD